VGRETVLIDPGPDLDFQLDREGLRKIDRIFITHWHFDHVGGLAGLMEPAQHAQWPPIHIYFPHQLGSHFEQELIFMKPRLVLHPIRPSDIVPLPDGEWEVVKTSHTDHSVGFILPGRRKTAYLVDGVVPPPETLARLDGVERLILEATVDELDEAWMNFALPQAVEFWKQTKIEQCLLTHLSCHRWTNKKLSAGLSSHERSEYEARHPGLTFAFDGMRIKG